MESILTMTFSPCIDKSFSVPSIAPDHKLRCGNVKLEAGGGGINVARAIRKLGGSPIAIYPVGSYTGETFDELFLQEGIRRMRVSTEAETRENMIAHDEATKQQYRFVMPVPRLLSNEWDELLSTLKCTIKPGFLIISGSFPEGTPENIFEKFSHIAKQYGAKLVVDTSGEQLKRAIKEELFLIKPNLGELARLTGQPKLLPSEALNAAKDLLSRINCQVIVVSMGAAGALLVTGQGSEMIPAPQVKQKSTVGAGDSMVAGIVWSLSQQHSLEDAVRYGVACGSAATLNPGTELCLKSDADNLYNQLMPVKL